MKTNKTMPILNIMVGGINLFYIFMTPFTILIPIHILFAMISFWAAWEEW